MATRLDQILARTRLDVTLRASTADHRALDRRAALHQPRGFAAHLRRAAEQGPAVIAELKKASPSRGLIRSAFDPAALARALQAGGAAALSVLTDEPFFQGSLRNLELASAASALPCLRKDFILDPFQLLEARAHGADAILLIVAALPDATLRTLRETARRLGLDVLCEVHTAAELDRALHMGCEAIGVNSRDLRDFTIHLDTLAALVPRIPDDVVRVAESGIASGDEMLRLRALGFDAFLIGEALMRQPDPGQALAAMLAPAPIAAR